MKIKALYLFTGVLLLTVAIGAIYAGIGFILKPDGSYLGLNVNLLKDSPFKTFLIPGYALLIVNGLGSLLGSSISFKQSLVTGKVTYILGFSMVIWILAQVYWIGFQSILQVIFLAVGIVEILLGWMMSKNQWRNSKKRVQDDSQLFPRS
ncbi:MAG: hypothetical protein ACQEXB_27320 [Bacillota bacterium]